MRISLAPILDFFINFYSRWINERYLEKKILDSNKIEEAEAVSAHTK